MEIGEETARRAARAALDRLWRRGRDFLGTELAVMGGAMTWVSERRLVAAISNGGGFGVIACGAMTPELLQKEIAIEDDHAKAEFGTRLAQADISCRTWLCSRSSAMKSSSRELVLV